MPLLATAILDGCHQVTMRDGAALPIRHAGATVAAFNPGWVPVGVIDLFAPAHLLVLHRDREIAVWYLDRDMDRVGGTLAELPDPYRRALLARAADLFAGIVAACSRLGAVAPDATPFGILADLSALGETRIADLATWVAGSVAVTTIDRREPPSPALAAAAPHADAAFAGTVKEAYLELMRGNGFGCASPRDGVRREALIGMPVASRQPIYLFEDRQPPEPAGRPFFLMPDAYSEFKAAIYLPEAGIYLTAPGALPFAQFYSHLLTHLVVHHARIARFLASPEPKHPVVVPSDFPVLHIGHVVWNDLSALDELARSFPPDRLPWVCVMNVGEGSEVFGRLDDLFPEFRGRVIRSERTWEHVPELVYDRNLFHVRFLSRHVGRDVGRRVLAHLAHDPMLTADRQLADRLAADRRACVCLGLRFGNRTMPDQLGFLVAVVDHLRRRLPRLAVVVDGTSARIDADPSTIYGSFGPAEGERGLLSELETVFALRRHFQADEGVRIIGTVGRPIAASLFWIERCAFFVAPWGAALAKYRWICNRPGFVVSARAMLRHPEGDLVIYHDPRFMEDPSRMDLIALDAVADAPGPGGFYANFVPDPDAVRAGVDRMLEHTGLVPAA